MFQKLLYHFSQKVLGNPINSWLSHCYCVPALKRSNRLKHTVILGNLQGTAESGDNPRSGHRYGWPILNCLIVLHCHLIKISSGLLMNGHLCIYCCVLTCCNKGLLKVLAENLCLLILWGPCVYGAPVSVRLQINVLKVMFKIMKWVREKNMRI